MKKNIHGGNLRKLSAEHNISEEDIIDFSANINPLGFPDWLRTTIMSNISNLAHYPDPEYKELREKIATKHGVNYDQISVYNGASETFSILPSVLDARKAIIPMPSFSNYYESCVDNNIEVIPLYMIEKDCFEIDYKKLDNLIGSIGNEKLIVYLGHPNNPTGKILNRKKIVDLAAKYSNCYFVIDEAFIDFIGEANSFAYTLTDNMIISRSLTKILAIPGLRLAYSISNEKICRLILNKLSTWNLNKLSEAIGIKALEDRQFPLDSYDYVKRERVYLSDLMNEINGVETVDGSGNFILIKFKNKRSSDVVDFMIKNHSIAVRNAELFEGLSDGYIRVAVRTRDENLKLVKSLKDFLSSDSPIIKMKKKTPAMMLQGTSSNAGKSILGAAFCRILYQDGIKVAPFKAQNMSLNSHVTPFGEEIGRAQAVQAQAANVVMDSRMNPVLLKPSSEVGSQVIVCGKPLAHMNFKVYSENKKKIFEEVKKAYDSLADEYDAIVLEGAGSASEVNLKHNDIVNMNMARYAGADVYLVSDIDRGGIFGSLIGTMNTLTEWERKLVKGMIINRFRGIKDLLLPGVNYLQDVTNVPVTGIVNNIKGLNIPEEDSLDFKLGLQKDVGDISGRVDIALIQTPYISNFTDADPFSIEDDVRIRSVKNLNEFGNPDAIILPGSKSVLKDLSYLVESGLYNKIREYANHKVGLIAGICGGYQILGEKICDPLKIESNIEEMDGLGLLPVKTVMNKEKNLGQTSASCNSTGHKLVGYEIHHGETEVIGNCKIFIENSNCEAIGHSVDRDMIWGSYLHGIFDNDEFRRDFIDNVRERKGMARVGRVINKYDLTESLDILADAVRDSVNMDEIYKRMGL